MPRKIGKVRRYVRKFRLRAKSVKRIVRRELKKSAETKYVVAPISFINSAAGGLYYTSSVLVSNLSQGTGHSNRVGDSIQLTGLAIKFAWNVRSNSMASTGQDLFDTQHIVRLSILTNKPGVSPAQVQTYLNSSWSTGVGTTGYPDYELVKLLKDKWYVGTAWNMTYAFPLSTDPNNVAPAYGKPPNLAGVFKWARRMNKKMKYDTDDSNYTTTPMNKQYWIVITFSNDNTQQGLPPVIEGNGYVKYTFKDM